MRSILRRVFGNSPIWAFNLILRDRWIAARAAEVAPGSRVLDVGAGSCPYRPLFSHCEYKSQDFSSLKDEQLRTGGYGTIDYVCDATAIPVAAGSFDVALSTEMIEHVPDPVAVLREIARVLRPGGRLILTAPLGSGIHQEPFHYFGGFTPYWHQKVLGELGFDQISVEPNGGFFRYFGQEAIRFLRLSAPTRMPFLPGLLWLPFWLLLFPLFAGIMPLLGPWLDRFDHERRFTVGYHVTARRTA